MLTQCGDLAPVYSFDNAHPRRIKRDPIPGEFALYRRWNYNLRVKVAQQVKFAYSSEIQDR